MENKLGEILGQEEGEIAGRFETSFSRRRHTDVNTQNKQIRTHKRERERERERVIYTCARECACVFILSLVVLMNELARLFPTAERRIEDVVEILEKINEGCLTTKQIRNVIKLIACDSPLQTMISRKQMKDFISRCGPLRLCCRRALDNFFESTGRLYPWFHGKISRSQSTALIERAGGGSFLIRASERHADKFTVVYGEETNQDGIHVRNVLLINLGSRGYVVGAKESSESYKSLKDFVDAYRTLLQRAVPSELSNYSMNLAHGYDASGVDHDESELPPPADLLTRRLSSLVDPNSPSRAVETEANKPSCNSAPSDEIDMLERDIRRVNVQIRACEDTIDELRFACKRYVRQCEQKIQEKQREIRQLRRRRDRTDRRIDALEGRSASDRAASLDDRRTHLADLEHLAQRRSVVSDGPASLPLTTLPSASSSSSLSGAGGDGNTSMLQHTGYGYCNRRLDRDTSTTTVDREDADSGVLGGATRGCM